MDSDAALRAAVEQPPSLLVVDDAPDQLQALTELLSGQGWLLTCATSGEEALAAIARQRPDLVLLDVVLPQIDGVEVLRRIKADPKTQDLPVLFVTSRPDPEAVAPSLEAGAADYIHKPFNANELLARVRMQLALKQCRDRERRLIAELQGALAKVKQMSGMVPICAHCKKIRNDDGFWQQVEEFVSVHSDALITHGLCPECTPLSLLGKRKPEAAKEARSPAGAPAAAEAAPLQKILIVDDTPSNIRILVQFLRADYKLLVATDGQVALETAAQERPDLILLDVMMPQMDGHEVCRRLKEAPLTRQIPVIFVTAKTEEEDETEGFSLGAVDYITKPFSMPVVQARVRTHLELKRTRDALERQSMVDALTGIPNRRAFQEFLELMWSQSVRQETPIAAIILDVDHFKAFNDAYGHQSGDECLRRVARALAAAKRRNTDLIARYGGEEFVCILPGTDQEGGRLVAEALRAAVEELGIPHAGSSAADHVTVSLGMAAWVPRKSDQSQKLVEAADRALYQAKQSGRNRVGAL